MKVKAIFMRITDITMTVILLLLMSMQVTQQMPHEWLGIAMTVLFIVHHIFNYRYYKTVFKGKYTTIRIIQLMINTLLYISILITPFSGMMMSRYATPFMNGLLSSMLVRKLHLVFSYWSFVLMGLHIGLHFGIITNRLPKGKFRLIIESILSAVAVYGFKLFLDAGIFRYMFFQSQFAFLDYSKAWWLVLLENTAMLFAWVWIAYTILMILKNIPSKKRKSKNKKQLILYAVMLIATVCLGMIF
ncbi:MAG: DUF4405 domain-containing protein [Clostridia bacterium]|nr:DUF4405 domain-containing protein [Clostridia bacterium]